MKAFIMKAIQKSLIDCVGSDVSNQIWLNRLPIGESPDVYIVWRSDPSNREDNFEDGRIESSFAVSCWGGEDDVDKLFALTNKIDSDLAGHLPKYLITGYYFVSVAQEIVQGPIDVDDQYQVLSTFTLRVGRSQKWN